MTFYFGDSISKFETYTEEGWLYFFSTQDQTKEGPAFVKFGLTANHLVKRLKQYTTPVVANIYAIQVPCVELSIREGAMKQVFKVCKAKEDINIWQDYNIEYIKGNLELMLRVYLYFSTVFLEEAYKYKSKQVILNEETIVSWMEKLPEVNNYKIEHLITPQNKEKTSLEDRNDESSDESKIKEERCVCNKCGKECKDKRGLTVHSHKCGIDKHFICEFCNQEFATAYSLSIHVPRCKTLKSKKELTAKEEMANLQSDLQAAKNDITKLLSLQQDAKEESVKHQNNLKDYEFQTQEQIKNIQEKYKKDLLELKTSLRIDFEQQLKLRDNDILLIMKDYTQLKAEFNIMKLKNEMLEKENKTLSVDKQKFQELSFKLLHNQ